MLILHLALTNPWSRRFRNLYNRTGLLRGNLCWDFEIMQTADLVVLKFGWTMAQDHAGPYIELGLLGYTVGAHVYDRRHWNYQNNRWEQ